MSAPSNPRVELRTQLGDIVIELLSAQAPIGCSNFLAYVEQGLLNSGNFYRAMRPEHWSPGRELCLIQAGLAGTGVAVLPPIPHESGTQTGLLHKRGTVSYARAEPGTAGSEFFICVQDCPGLDPTSTPVPPADGLGYAVFGRVVFGMDVVERIHASPTSLAAPIELLQGQMLSPAIKVLAAERLPEKS